MDSRSLIAPADAVLFVVDLQERLLPAIHESDACVDAAGRMIDAARVFGLPVLATEQYPEGLGPTCPPIRERLAGVPVIEKTRFSACVEPVLERLRELHRTHVIVAGIETHVCVQQTVLDLLHLDHAVYVCADAVGSRRPHDRDTALMRMRTAGAVVTTTESVTFELLGDATHKALKRILNIVR